VINSNIGRISHCFPYTATYSLNIRLKIVAEPMQMETWLLF